MSTFFKERPFHSIPFHSSTEPKGSKSIESQRASESQSHSAHKSLTTELESLGERWRESLGENWREGLLLKRRGSLRRRGRL